MIHNETLTHSFRIACLLPFRAPPIDDSGIGARRPKFDDKPSRTDLISRPTITRGNNER